MAGSNERRQPFFGYNGDVDAFWLIRKEFYLTDEHRRGMHQPRPSL